jgi:hypothetical protein
MTCKCAIPRPIICSCNKESPVLITKENMHKQWQTRDGRQVRILAVDIKTNEPYTVAVAAFGAFGLRGDVESIYIVNPNGRAVNSLPQKEHVDDIIPCKTKKSGWINIYNEGINGVSTGGTIHPTKEAAKNYASAGVITTILISWEE